MSFNDKKNFLHAKSCYVCGVIFLFQSDKVRDHDHFDNALQTCSNYRGAACISCNAYLRKKRFLPVIAHSSRSYDSHFLVRCLNEINYETISVIPQNLEKYTAIILDHLIFIDSFLFLSTSLSVLANNL